MLPELKVYNLLENSPELNALMDSIRGDARDEQLIYTNDIPEELSFYADAPIIRVTFVQDRIISADDDDLLTNSTVEVDFWTRSLTDSSKLTPLIRKVLRDSGWYQFDNARKKDPDSADSKEKLLYMNTIWVKSDPYQ